MNIPMPDGRPEYLLAFRENQACNIEQLFVKSDVSIRRILGD